MSDCTTYTNFCIHRFDIKGVFRGSEYRQCSKCNLKHIHSPKCIIHSCNGSKTCKITNEVISEAVTHYYDTVQNTDISCGRKRTDFYDYMTRIIKHVEDAADQKNLRIICNEYCKEEIKNRDLKEIISKTPRLVAIGILLHYYKKMTYDKNISLKEQRNNCKSVAFIQCQSSKSRAVTYQLSNTDGRAVTHRRVYKIFKLIVQILPLHFFVDIEKKISITHYR